MTAYLIFRSDEEDLIEAETLQEALKMKEEGWETEPEIAVSIEDFNEVLTAFDNLLQVIRSRRPHYDDYKEAKEIIEKYRSQQ